MIALLWNSVVVGGLKVAGIDTALEDFDLGNWLGYVVTAIVLTIVMIIFIIIIGRWGNK